MSTSKMSAFEPNPAMAARAALFDTRLELAGVRLQLFAERLLEAADASPRASCDQLVRTAIGGIDGGALAVVAEEPELCYRPLTRPASSVQEAAEIVMHELGIRLLAVHSKH